MAVGIVMDIDYAHASGVNGIVTIGRYRAAEILGCNPTTIDRMKNRQKAGDAARLAYLEAVACKRIIPADWGLWVDAGEGTLRTDTGDSFNKSELGAYSWLRAAHRRAVEGRRAERDAMEAMKEKVAALERENSKLRAALQRKGSKSSRLELDAVFEFR